MKKLLSLTTLLVVALCTLNLVSCSKDEDGGSSSSIVGIWICEDGEYNGETFLHVLRFYDDGTVTDYSTVSDNGNGWSGADPVVLTDISGYGGVRNWYYSPDGMRTLTYIIDGNSIILSDYTILTHSNNTLKNGSSVYKKR